MNRRRRLFLAILPAAVAGCGFELRRTPELRFHNIALVGFEPRSPLADELRRALTDANVQVLDNPAQAELVLEVLGDVRERSVVASTAAGQVRQVQLRQRLNFHVHTGKGRELIPAADIALWRDMSYSETVALAKEQEEALLFRAMRSDIVAQLMRRLAALQAP